MRYAWLVLALLFAPSLCAQDDVRRGFAQLEQAHPGFIKVADLPGADNLSFSATIRDFSVTGALPGVLLVGSVHGREQEPAVACLRIAQALLEDETLRDQLKTRELIIIPSANPGGRLARLNGVPLAFDDDRDGKSDEDGPSDLNGDGLITQMRIKRKGGKYVVSKNDPRVLIAAQPGQVGEWDVLWEGKDDDGDGHINEDPRGTITLANDWAIRWSDKQPGANRFMMQLKQTRVLAEFVQARPSLVAGFQLRSIGGGPEFAQGPKRPPGSTENRDKEMTSMLAKLWTPEAKSKGESEGAGNLLDWLYEDRGMYAANLFLAELPEPKKDDGEKDEDRDEDGEEDTEEHADEAPAKPTRGSVEKPGAEESRQLAWLAYTPKDYVEWKTFTHPQLGEVEIGGWRIDRRSDPTESDAEAGATRVGEYLKSVLLAMPKLEVSKVEVEDKGDNLYRVRATIHNSGKLDYRSSFSEDNRIHLPLFVSLTDSKDVELLSGTRRVKLENLQAGATTSFEWFVRVKGPDTELKLKIESKRTGDLNHTGVVKDCPAIKTEDE